MKSFTGHLIQWYDDGMKQCEEIFIDGKREGQWPSWSPGGIKCMEEHYENREKKVNARVGMRMEKLPGQKNMRMMEKNINLHHGTKIMEKNNPRVCVLWIKKMNLMINNTGHGYIGMLNGIFLHDHISRKSEKNYMIM